MVKVLSAFCLAKLFKCIKGVCYQLKYFVFCFNCMPHLLFADSRLINNFRYFEGNLEKCSCGMGRCPVTQFMCLIICTKSRLVLQHGNAVYE